MTTLYQTLSQGKIGIFESPTGTGKSLSLICGSLQWLKDHGSSNGTVIPVDEADEPDWVRSFTVNKYSGESKDSREKFKQDMRQRIQRIREQEASDSVLADARMEDDDDAFLLEDYTSDDDDRIPKDSNSNLSKEVQALLAKFDTGEDSDTEHDESNDKIDDEFDELKLVVLPYQYLIHSRTRESLGISLKDNIVIVDEAHNLMETITSIYTISVTRRQIRMTLSQLILYLQRYQSRLLGKNIIYIKQIISITKALLRVLEPTNGEKKDHVLGVNDFVHLAKIDHLNMFKIERYLKESSLARKLNGFVDKVREREEKEREKAGKMDSTTNKAQKNISSIPTLTQIEAFLTALTNPDKDGRIVVNFSGEADAAIKYMLLNPADAFQPIVEESKSVILAGGTMEPISDFITHLFPTVPSERISRFSCGHIIPPENLLTLTIDEGPTGKPLLFTFESRQDMKMIDEVGQIVVNLCNVIPDGVVCFFASFSFLEDVHRRWSTMDGGNVLARLSKKKKIFKEPRESNMVDSTLRDYSLAIESNQSGGALLLCVVNGKMSEGINFSDRLGRGVIMVGLPFANKTSVELNEKMKYARENKKQEGSSTIDGGQAYYENLCMRGGVQYGTKMITLSLFCWTNDILRHGYKTSCLAG
ncbi:ATP-dependent DNA helicase chl1 [Apophysomyces sp. BC1015]|nr:ATP-dependent DNA helicase chl1 [Apophysomyces sp. BC1015]